MQNNKTALHFSTKISYISLSLSLSLSRLRWLNMYHQARLISIVLASNSKFFPMRNFKKLSRKYSVNIYYICILSTSINDYFKSRIYLIVHYVKNIQVDLVHVRHDIS